MDGRVAYVFIGFYGYLKKKEKHKFWELLRSLRRHGIPSMCGGILIRY